MTGERHQRLGQPSTHQPSWSCQSSQQCRGPMCPDGLPTCLGMIPGQLWSFSHSQYRCLLPSGVSGRGPGRDTYTLCVRSTRDSKQAGTVSDTMMRAYLKAAVFPCASACVASSQNRSGGRTCSQKLLVLLLPLGIEDIQCIIATAALVGDNAGSVEVLHFNKCAPAPVHIETVAP